jgi:hypothetical protein
MNVIWRIMLIQLLKLLGWHYFGMIMRTHLFVGPREDPKVFILLPLYFECTKCIEVESEYE